MIVICARLYWHGYPYVYLLLVLCNISHDNLTARDNYIEVHANIDTVGVRSFSFPRVILVGKNSFEYLTIVLPTEMNRLK